MVCFLDSLAPTGLVDQRDMSDTCITMGLLSGNANGGCKSPIPARLSVPNFWIKDLLNEGLQLLSNYCYFFIFNVYNISYIKTPHSQVLKQLYLQPLRQYYKIIWKTNRNFL